ncbi:helix-turn-helix domain-containing protein [Pseudomonas lalucatii]|uniref:Helix-turn-helix domain-containing protein n=1 Tax=Pseudomonas lalucatii TaxID=1424203 RepID=A0ABS5PWX0_9PSED|nr:AraC family transcriptional regulator [Pseudomonas lalucatii]MBS7660983.1 helix-turn-helix domain-containing protein [Pseudomonas lalucatii]MBS7724350.1 helix-turn-helix domain-containing protein [Pseudomonas lalucatii]
MSALLSLRHYSHDLLSHSHGHAQLVFGLSGRLDFEVAGRSSQVIRQTLAVVPAETRHACGSREGSQCLVLDVPSQQWLQQRLGDHADASLRLLDRPGSLALDTPQSQLVSWLAASPINDPVIAEQGAALLLASLAAGAQRLGEGRRLPLAALDAHIDRHAAHPLQVGDLARLAGLSTARFHTRFLDEVGQTPMEYVRRRRLQLARHLLENSHLSVGDIAARVGYGSQSAFTAALSRQFGMTPRALRRACE